MRYWLLSWNASQEVWLERQYSDDGLFQVCLVRDMHGNSRTNSAWITMGLQNGMHNFWKREEISEIDVFALLL